LDANEPLPEAGCYVTTMESVLFELLRSKDALLGAKRATCWKHGDPVDDVDGMVIFFSSKEV